LEPGFLVQKVDTQLVYDNYIFLYRVSGTRLNLCVQVEDVKLNRIFYYLCFLIKN